MSHTRFKVNVHCSCLNVKKFLAQNRCDIWGFSNCNKNQSHNHLVYKCMFNTLALLETPFSSTRLTLTKIGRLEIKLEKLLTWLEDGDILNSMSQTREKWDSLVLSGGDFWMIWRCHNILVFIFIFLFKNVIREQLDGNDFCRCYGHFFVESVILKVLDHSYV